MRKTYKHIKFFAAVASAVCAVSLLELADFWSGMVSSEPHLVSRAYAQPTETYDRTEHVTDGEHVIHQRLFWSPEDRKKTAQAIRAKLAKKGGKDDNTDPSSEEERLKLEQRRAVLELNQRRDLIPPLSTEVGRDELVFGQSGPLPTAKDDPQLQDSPNGLPFPNDGRQQLDDRTGKVQQTRYHATFSPSVAPYKRSNVQNRVIYGPTLETYLDPGHTDELSVPVGKIDVSSLPKQVGVDRFWGSFPLKFERVATDDYRRKILNKNNTLAKAPLKVTVDTSMSWVPIPSIAPNQRIVRAEVEPASFAVHFRRDDAGNFFVGSPSVGLARVNVVIDVDPFYFNGPLDDALTWDAIDAAKSSRRLTTGITSSEHEKEAILTVLKPLGISRQVPPAKALTRLVNHFREFVPSEGTSPRSSAAESALEQFHTLMSNKVGVCRHRAILFLAAMDALGLPTHYVNNEAHAFVEVFWPSGGARNRWRRIDLGGAAEDMSFSNLDGKPIHIRQDKSFAEPKSYVDNAIEVPQSAIAGTARDAAGGYQLPGSSSSAEDIQPPPTSNPNPSHGTPQNVAQPATDDAAPKNRDNHNTGRIIGLPDDNDKTSRHSTSTHAQKAEKPKKSTRVQIIGVESKVQRGMRTTVTAKLTSNGNYVVRKRVAIYLGAVGKEDPSAAVKLGTELTNALGEAYVNVEIPADLKTGRWSIFAYFEGDDSYDAAISQ